MEHSDNLDDFVDILNEPRVWPPPTMAEELMAIMEKQRPGFTERAEKELRRRKWHPLKGDPTVYLAKHPHIDFVNGSPKQIAHAKLRAKQRLVAWQRRERKLERGAYMSNKIADILEGDRGPEALRCLTALEQDVITLRYGIEGNPNRNRVFCLRSQTWNKLHAKAHRKLFAWMRENINRRKRRLLAVA